MEKNKIILVDWGYLVHKTIYAYPHNPSIPPEYTALNMLFSWLKKVGVNIGDKIFIAVDCGKSWRKQYDQTYKSGRKAQREKHQDIDWKVMFAKMDRLLEKIDRATEFFVVKKDSFEADDWMSVACRYYYTSDVVLVTVDSDVHQLLAYPNVKVFSPLRKYKSVKGDYVREEVNPYKLLAKKIEKETSDGLTNPVLNEAEYETRKLIVNLLSLPEFVEIPIMNTFATLPEFKECYPSDLPFEKMRTKYEEIYTDKSKIVPYILPPKKERKKNVKS